MTARARERTVLIRDVAGDMLYQVWEGGRNVQLYDEEMLRGKEGERKGKENGWRKELKCIHLGEMLACLASGILHLASSIWHLASFFLESVVCICRRYESTMMPKCLSSSNSPGLDPGPTSCT